MLNGSLVDLADWEQTMTAKHPETDTLHWHRQDPEWTCGGFRRPPPTGQVKEDEDNIFHAVTNAVLQSFGDHEGHIRCDGHGVESGSLFCALAYFFEHFSHDVLLREFPSPKEPIGTPKELRALAKFKRSELKPHQFLRWLAILVGDLHQPLHWLREHSYGGDLHVIYRGHQMRLLSLWEELIPQHLPALGKADKLQKAYQFQSPAWLDTMPTQLFRMWGMDMARAVCQHVYSPLEGNGTDGSGNSTSPFTINEELFRKWVDLGQEFTTLGGQRLAFVLNEILEHRRHKTLHKEGRGRHHRRRNWSRSLGINLAISGVVAPLLLVLFRWHYNTGGAGLRGLASHLKM